MGTSDPGSAARCADDSSAAPKAPPIVLGAGGPLAWAFHLGVLDGFREVTGREPSDTSRIIGTSAGAAIAAALLDGMSTAEVLELISTPPDDDARDEMFASVAAARRKPLTALRPQAPGLVRNVRQTGLATALVGLLPAGLFPTFPLRKFATGDQWPEPLWIPSVRLDDGQVVVFGRDAVHATLADAIEATSAVPAMFRHKEIDGARFVDGAVASSTHADLLIGEGHHGVLISAPMARAGRGAIKVRARRALAREVDALEASGARCHVVIPDEAAIAAAEGYPRTNPDAGAAIVAAGRRQTIAALADVAGHSG